LFNVAGDAIKHFSPGYSYTHQIVTES